MGSESGAEIGSKAVEIGGRECHVSTDLLLALAQQVIAPQRTLLMRRQCAQQPPHFQCLFRRGITELERTRQVVDVRGVTSSCGGTIDSEDPGNP